MVNTQEDVREMDLFVLLGDLLCQVRRTAVLGGLLVGLCALMLTGYRSVCYGPVYEAVASFAVQAVGVPSQSTEGYSPAAAAQLRKTILAIVNDDLLRERALDTQETGQGADTVISAGAEGNVITVTVRDSEPQRSEAVLDSVLTQLPEIAQYVVGPIRLMVLEESGIPTEPAEPFRIGRSLLQGAAAGAVIWALLAGLLALRWNPVHDPEELSCLLDCDCLGCIPEKTGSMEAVRQLVPRLEKRMVERGKILLVSAAVSGEGKNQVCVKLAEFIARTGKRVLIIDCDLRTPSVAEKLDLDSEKGLAQYLWGEAALDEMIQKTDVKGLYAVPGGTGDALLADRLGQKEMERLLQYGREHFDRVILDTPPCSLLADASELAELADAALLVVRPRWASREQILEGALCLQDSGLPLLGCVMNRGK